VADWVTISSLATAGGTLVLAAATFAAVRSAHQNARVTERALMAAIRPVLVPSRLTDPPEKVGFLDDHWIKVEAGRAVADITDDAIYLTFGLRNVGSGLAVLDRWEFIADLAPGNESHGDPQGYRRLTRDLYIPGGDLGFWQRTFRDPDEPIFKEARDAITARQRMGIDLLYGDHEGGQHTITRFALIPRDDGQWITSVSRHWTLDRPDPR
jgi:hypothetical protein